MLAIHDVKLELNDYIAQYDFVLITSKCIFVLKTKQLNGDIDITEDGDFIRIIKDKDGKFLRRQGMYNPITYNERCSNILKEVLSKEKLLNNAKVKSVVVISNPKTIINKSKCPKNIKDNLYKYDQICNLINKTLEEEKYLKELSEKNMHEIANYLINNNKEENIDYMSKYELDEEDFKSKLSSNKLEYSKAIKEKDIEMNKDKYELKENKNNDNSNNNQKIYESLKQYRLNKAKEEGFKAYMVFTNEELNSLIEARPKNKDELLKVKGFGLKKVEKYGEKILDILNN